MCCGLCTVALHMTACAFNVFLHSLLQVPWVWTRWVRTISEHGCVAEHQHQHSSGSGDHACCPKTLKASLQSRALLCNPNHRARSKRSTRSTFESGTAQQVRRHTKAPSNPDACWATYYRCTGQGGRAAVLRCSVGAWPRPHPCRHTGHSAGVAHGIPT